MKAFCILLALMFLASCGISTPESNSSTGTSDITLQQINDATSELPDEVIDLMEDTSSSSDGDDNASEISSGEENSLEESQDVAGSDEDIIVNETPQDIKKNIQESKGDETSSDDQASITPSVVELSTTYNNPAMQVVMNIQYTLRSDNTIDSISVSSPNYKGMPQFNSAVQEVVGMSVEDASEYYVSGSSLTTSAFQAALKNS